MRLRHVTQLQRPLGHRACADTLKPLKFLSNMGKKSKRRTPQPVDHVLTPEAASPPSPLQQPRKTRPTVAQNAQQLETLATKVNDMHEHFQSVTSLLEDLASRMPAAAGHAGSPGRQK